MTTLTYDPYIPNLSRVNVQSAKSVLFLALIVHGYLLGNFVYAADGLEMVTKCDGCHGAAGTESDKVSTYEGIE